MSQHENLNEYLTNLDKLKGMSEEQIRELIKKYPYVQNLHLILNKKISQGQNDIFQYSEKFSPGVDFNRKVFQTLAIDSTENNEEITEINVDNKTIDQSQEIVKDEDPSKVESEAIAAISEVKEKPVLPDKLSQDEVEVEKEEELQGRKTEPQDSILTPQLPELEQQIEPAVEDIEFEHDYDLSSFANWLLSHPIERNKTVISQEVKKPEQDIKSKQKMKQEKKKEKKEKKKKKTLKNKARQSVSVDESIISESLAQLLAEQKHYKKAIKMYRKLGLIFPEKSAYFAAQMKKIKKRHK